ncbi:zinc finger protein 626 [Teleopsis dalmanni]|uniref:zinc finger protein 626 n=1 Tax=Teleopsis dalmanni TaxID=139649 RepID=UPI000D32D262|nr:zinc finger protein 626 [Teleopsis dalmanni]
MSAKCDDCEKNSNDKCLQCIKDQENQIVVKEILQISRNRKATRNSKKCRKKTPSTQHIQKLQLPNGDVQYRCICGRTFNSRTQQYYHLRCGDASVKKFICDKCEKDFASRSHLKYHLETHNSESHVCTECSKTFMNQIVLKKHMKLHKSSSVKCSVCFKIFRNNETLSTHMKLHSDTFSFQCHICQKKYAIKSSLQQHMLKHLEKKYVCHCGKRFQRTSTLKTHKKRHLSKETFFCKICLKNFTDIGSLSRHEKIHSDSVKYKCRHCDILTKRKDNMLRHVRNIHLGEQFSECVITINPEPTMETDEPYDSSLLANKIKSVSEEINIPKTVRNSSVIKCIGNVEPVKIPDENSDEYALELTYEPLKNVNLSKIEPEKKAHRLKRKYDQIERYRKILYPDENDEEDENHETIKVDQMETCSINQPEDSTQKTHEFAQRPNTSNFSEMHWRKKYQEEYQEN